MKILASIRVGLCCLNPNVSHHYPAPVISQSNLPQGHSDLLHLGHYSAAAPNPNSDSLITIVQLSMHYLQTYHNDIA